MLASPAKRRRLGAAAAGAALERSGSPGRISPRTPPLDKEAAATESHGEDAPATPLVKDGDGDEPEPRRLLEVPQELLTPIKEDMSALRDLALRRSPRRARFSDGFRRVSDALADERRRQQQLQPHQPLRHALEGGYAAHARARLASPARGAHAAVAAAAAAASAAAVTMATSSGLASPPSGLAGDGMAMVRRRASSRALHGEEEEEEEEGESDGREEDEDAAGNGPARRGRSEALRRGGRSQRRAGAFRKLFG